MARTAYPLDPTLGDLPLRLELAQTRLLLTIAETRYAILEAATSGSTSAPDQPGPRWQGAAH